MAAGTLRQDLHYRLNVFPNRVSSVRDRADDVPRLIQHLIEWYASQNWQTHPKDPSERVAIVSRVRLAGQHP